MIVLAGLLVAPAVAIGDHLLALIGRKSTKGDVQTPAWSPDGQKLAFVSRRDGNSEIYVMNADGSAQENLTRQPASDSHPSWSRDGRQILFVSRRDGNAEIYVMNVDGSGLRNLTRTPSDDLDPAWSPDGRAIAFVRPMRATPTTRARPLRDVPLRRECRRERAAATDDTPDAGVESKLVGGREDYPVRALPRACRRQRAHGVASERPARRSVVARRAADRRRGGSPAALRTPTKIGLFVMNADGSDARRVAPKATSGGPAWYPDGRRIAFRMYDGQIGSGFPGNSDLFVVNADGSGLRRLTHQAENVRWFAWSPDGRTIAYLRNREVYIVKADGSGERRLTQLDN